MYLLFYVTNRTFINNLFTRVKSPLCTILMKKNIPLAHCQLNKMQIDPFDVLGLMHPNGR